MGLTYNGATAGSTLANPPVILDSVIGGQLPNSPGLLGAKVWFITSTNAATDFSGTLNAINDGIALGVKAGDVLIGVTATAGSTSPILYLGVFVSSAASTGVALSSNVLTSTAV